MAQGAPVRYSRGLLNLKHNIPNSLQLKSITIHLYSMLNKYLSDVLQVLQSHCYSSSNTVCSNLNISIICEERAARCLAPIGNKRPAVHHNPPPRLRDINCTGYILLFCINGVPISSTAVCQVYYRY